jgi:hypothetical protein
MLKTLLLLLSAATMTLAATGRPATQTTAPLSLAGEWRFALDPAAEQREIIRQKGEAPPLPEGEGIAQRWFARDLEQRIKLPGILQAQGYGNDISASTPWILTLGDAWWKLQPEALREHFSQPGHVEVPFLSQPPKHYLGVAWYQRDIDIPESWAGRRAELFLERPHWETRVWIDDQPFAAQRSLVAPHVSELGLLKPGRHRLTIRVDNRQLLHDPVDDFHSLDGHSVSDALGASWNGIVGRIELRSTTPVWIDDAQVYPNVSDKTARVRVRIGNVSGRAGGGKLTIGGKSAEVSWDASGGTGELVVPLEGKAQTWDEFHPALQHLTVVLEGDGAGDRRELTFGLREISHRERDFILNGRVLNLRLNHSGGDFPLTGYPATDVESWKKIIRTCQDFGMNGIRFHSWCPPEAAFTAADELGFYLQAECGLWAPFSPGSVYTEFMEKETERLLRHFGNHPSFILLSPSNEPGRDYQKVTPAWAVKWHEKDPRRLYAAGTGWNDPAQVKGGAQFAPLVRYAGGELRNRTAWFGGDFRKAVETSHIPILSHEVGQWCAYPDFDVIKEFTGYMRPSNYRIFRYIAEQEGVLDQNHAFAWASGRFQLACYKEEIEANLRTPNLAGYQLLDLHDYLGQGTALIGVLDAFWKPKSYVTAREFSRFNHNTVPLARLAKRTFLTSETLSSEVELYHFGEYALKQARPEWKIIDGKGRTVREGKWAACDIEIGKNIPLGTVTADLHDLPAPAAYRLVVGLKGLPVENDWNFWLYPEKVEKAAPEGVLVTRDWSAAEGALAAGRRVLFVPTAAQIDPARSPAMAAVPVFWNIQMTVRPPKNPRPRFDAMLGLLCDEKHPALAGFPTAPNCDWQWTPLVAGVRSVNLRNAPRDLHPIVAAIDDWNRNWRLGVIFECKVGPGRLLVSVIDLDADTEAVGLQSLRRSLLDYMAGPKFKPSATLTSEQVNQLWERGPQTAPTAPRAHDRDLDDGTGGPARKTKA